MKEVIFSVNEKLCPKEWAKFKKWHKLACKNDPLTDEERFIKLGGKIPKSKSNKGD